MGRTQEQNEKIEAILNGSQSHGATIDEIAKIRGWFRPQDGNEFYPVVQDYANRKIDLEEASSRLFKPIDDKIAENKTSDLNLLDLWYSIIQSARKLSFNDQDAHEHLVELVAAFKNHKVSGNEQNSQLYSSLNDFGMACREAFNDAPSSYGGYYTPEIEAWAGFNAFLAYTTLKGIQDLSLFAIWTLREALEDQVESDPRVSLQQKYDLLVPAASAWIIGMGKELYRLEKDLTPTDDRQGNPAKGGELWKGKAEFSKERWALWKSRFEDISKMDEVSDATKNLAKQTVQLMEQAEKA